MELRIVIGIGFIADVGYSDGSVSGGEHRGIEVCAIGDVLNGNSTGNIGKNNWEEYLVHTVG